MGANVQRDDLWDLLDWQALVDMQYSKAADNKLSFVYVFSIQTIPEIFELNVPNLFALIFHFIYSREYDHVTTLGRSDLWDWDRLAG